MNKAEAESILNDFASGHSGYGHGWQYGQSFYDAEFNIKMYYSNDFRWWLADLPDVQREYLGDACELDVLAWELECFIDLEIPRDKYPPKECWQAGRSGGWLVCRWLAPENGCDAIRLAHAIKRLDAAVREGKDYVSSIEFWQDHLDANCPVRVLEGCGL